MEHDQQFESFGQWVNKASSWLTRHADYGPTFRAICFDTKGRRCFCGADFHRARDEDAFPVRWLWPDQVAEMAAKLDAAEARIGALEEVLKDVAGWVGGMCACRADDEYYERIIAVLGGRAEGRG